MEDRPDRMEGYREVRTQIAYPSDAMMRASSRDTEASTFSNGDLNSARPFLGQVGMRDMRGMERVAQLELSQSSEELDPHEEYGMAGCSIIVFSIIAPSMFVAQRLAGKHMRLLQDLGKCLNPGQTPPLYMTVAQSCVMFALTNAIFGDDSFKSRRDIHLEYANSNCCKLCARTLSFLFAFAFVYMGSNKLLKDWQAAVEVLSLGDFSSFDSARDTVQCALLGFTYNSSTINLLTGLASLASAYNKVPLGWPCAKLMALPIKLLYVGILVIGYCVPIGIFLMIYAPVSVVISGLFVFILIPYQVLKFLVLDLWADGIVINWHWDTSRARSNFMYVIWLSYPYFLLVVTKWGCSVVARYMYIYNWWYKRKNHYTAEPELLEAEPASKEFSGLVEPVTDSTTFEQYCTRLRRLTPPRSYVKEVDGVFNKATSLLELLTHMRHGTPVVTQAVYEHAKQIKTPHHVLFAQYPEPNPIVEFLAPYLLVDAPEEEHPGIKETMIKMTVCVGVPLYVQAFSLGMMQFCQGKWISNAIIQVGEARTIGQYVDYVTDIWHGMCQGMSLVDCACNKYPSVIEFLWAMGSE